MFDGLGKSKFYSKCKSGVKLMKTRLEMVKKKRNAMQKYMRNDILDLLKNGLDVNAYGRAEGLLAEMNMSICYDFVDQFCEHISSNLAVMGKERECPKECKEAVSSLMYAAARFADLPELRELRTIFAERYGNSLDCFVNKEFVEKLKSTSPTMEMKFQVMQEIATEANVYWNPKATEKKLYDPSKNVRNDDHISARRTEHVEPKEYNPHHVLHNPGERTPFKDVQMDNTRNGHSEESNDSKAPSYSIIPPPYTKSKARDGSVSESDRKPASVRRQRLKPESGNEKDPSDEEEKTMDRLLMHYSKKESSPHGIVTEPAPQEASRRAMDRLLMHYRKKESSPHGIGTAPPPQEASGRAMRRQSWDSVPSSLLVEPSEAKSGHARAASLQSEMLNPTRLVHPKLPNYDDLLARLASLRGGN